MPDVSSLVFPGGPWQHRMVAANGARFHVVEAGEGPLVVLLHGFPQFWWTWRHLLPHLVADGYRVAAMDLRGYAGSDKPPRGYDPFTLSADVAGVIRSLGAADAVVVGHGVGGLVAWAMPVLRPQVTRAIGVISAAHPRDVRRAVLDSGEQRRASVRGLPLQLPFAPERRLTRQGGREVSALLTSWSARVWPDDSDKAVFAEAMTIPAAAHCALEFHRWAFRSLPRGDGRRFATAMRTPVHVPLLQLHGAADRVVLAETAERAGAHVSGPRTWASLPGLGHFPHEEEPDAVAGPLRSWLRSLPEPAGEAQAAH
ncbi:MAG: alpha/beta fold hydrolase [Actinomycetes bacterium]